MPKNIYNLSAEEILTRYKTSRQGLTDGEAFKRLRQYGPNQLEKKARFTWFHILLGQFNDALVWILLFAGVISFLFGELRDASIILCIVVINAAIGFLQEFKAERILESMKRFSKDSAVIIRSGEKKEIDSSTIVPGDLLHISAGDNVPADGYLLEAFDLKINSFVFTGESRPEDRRPEVMTESYVPLADVSNMVFSGETAVAGSGVCVVVATGMSTELGRIAHLAQKVREDVTPLQIKMRNLSKRVTLLSLGLGAAVVIVGQYFGMSMYENFLFALALAVSVVPEGLPAAISVALSLGMKSLLKNNVLAKKLNAVETLGSVSIVCTDKTGTITKNQLTVTRVIVNGKILTVSGVGYEPKGNFLIHGDIIDPKTVENLEMLMKTAVLCNDAALVQHDGHYAIVGDPTEGALLVAARKYHSDERFFRSAETKITEIPFASERMRMSTVFRNSKGTFSYVKGSPDVLLRLCSYKQVGKVVSGFSSTDKKETKAVYDTMSSNALRVLAFAYRDLTKVNPESYNDESERNLVWLGMMGMIDPAREDVAGAIANCRDLGVRVIMITGDYEVTAKAIARNIGLIGLKDFSVLNGKQLEAMSDSEIYRQTKKKDIVFARIAPEQKLRIANILKKYKETIAMTGDGVNDAPALKRADIGVAMGIMGTDVSKEASDMILLDDDFSSIVKGIRQGRTIFRNLQKFVYYVFTSNASELFTAVIGVLLQIPMPISALHVLATDLGTDLFPSFSLSLEPDEPVRKNMAHKKISRKSVGVVDGKVFWRIISMGFLMASGAVAGFLLSMTRGGWEFGADIAKDSELYIRSMSVAYAVISMTQMANLMQARSEYFSPFQLGFFKNPFTWGAVATSVGLLLVFLYLPFFQSVLDLRPIEWQDWCFVISMVLVVFVFEEIRKRLRQRFE